jgi:hypothetical protein
LKESKLIGKTDNYCGYNLTNKVINGINIGIKKEKDLENLDKDFSIMKSNIDKLIDNKLIPWIKPTKEFTFDKIKNDLKLYCISYSYNYIIAKYSPTKKDDYFGKFDFNFESKEGYTYIQAVGMEVYIKDNKILKVICYDI